MIFKIYTISSIFSFKLSVMTWSFSCTFHAAELGSGISGVWQAWGCLPPGRAPPRKGQQWAAWASCVKLYFLYFSFFFSSTSLLPPTHLPPPSCTHAQSCNPMDCNPPGSSVRGLSQARILEWVAISFSTLWTHLLCGLFIIKGCKAKFNLKMFLV